MRGKSAASAAFLWATTAVGYATSQEIAANTFSLGTTPFLAVGSDLVKVQDMLVPNGVTAPSFSNRTQALQLQVWNGTGYTMYYYVNDAYIEASDEEVTGWADKGGDYVGQTTTDVNYGFWVRSQGGEAGTLTFSL